MKKMLIVLFSMFLLFSFVEAVNLQADTNTAIADVANASKSFSDKTADYLQKDVQVSGFLASFLGVKDNDIDFQGMSILIILFFILLIIIREILLISPIFNGKGISWIASLIIVSLVSLSGGIYQGADIFFFLSGSIKFLAEHPVLRYFITIVFIALFMLGASTIVKILRDKMEIAEAEKTGADIVEGSIFARIFSKAGRKLAGKK